MSRAHVDDTPPVDLDIDNGAGITVGNTFQVASNRTIYAIWFWPPTTNTGTYTLGLWAVTDDDATGTGTGTLLDSVSVASADVVTGQYNRVEIDPQSVVTGTFYRVGRHASSGRYVRTAGALTSAGISNAGITIVQSGTAAFDDVVRNGTFDEGVALAYPASVFGQPDYHVDVDDEPLAGDTVEVDGNRSVAFGRTGSLLVDRNLQGNRSVGFNGSGSLRSVARAQGNASVGFTATGSISVRSDQPAEPTTNSAGWYTYLNILNNNAEEVRREITEPPEACPECGEPLGTSVTNVLFCPFDGWQFGMVR